MNISRRIPSAGQRRAIRMLCPVKKCMALDFLNLISHTSLTGLVYRKLIPLQIPGKPLGNQSVDTFYPAVFILVLAAKDSPFPLRYQA